MPGNGTSEQGASGSGSAEDRETRGSASGTLGALAIVAALSVVAAVVWVLGPDARSGSGRRAGPPPTASQSTSVGADGDDWDWSERSIYLWDPVSQIVRPLLSGRHDLANPELAPDGEWVVYENEDADGDPQIFLLGTDGTHRRLTDIPGGASDPAWSPDGRIAFAATPGRDGDDSEGDTDIFVMNGDGGHVRRLAGTPQNDGAPDWSPDGERIVFHSRFDDGRGLLWVTSAGSHPLERITAPAGWSAMDPAWSPDGRWIVFTRYSHVNTLNGNLFSGELALTRPDGTATRRVTKRRMGRPSGRVWTEPSWSPDGRLVLFEDRRWTEMYGNVRVIDPWASRRPERLLLDSWAQLDPNWSQGGIVFLWQSPGSPTPRPVPFAFEPAPPSDAAGIDAMITMTGSHCELEGGPRSIGPGRLMLRLINRSHHEAHFRVVRLRGTIGELRRRGVSFYFGRPLVASLDPSTTEVWSSKDHFHSGGRWAVSCHIDRIDSPNGFYIVGVGIVGPITVGAG